MRRVYVAAPWARKLEARKVVDMLQEAGLGVTSRWVERPETEYECSPELMRSEALRDLEDIAQSDVMLYLNLQKSEGKATELGMALERGLPVYVVGGRLNNVFLHLPVVTHLDSVGQFIAAALNDFGAPWEESHVDRKTIRDYWRLMNGK